MAEICWQKVTLLSWSDLLDRDFFQNGVFYYSQGWGACKYPKMIFYVLCHHQLEDT